MERLEPRHLLALVPGFIVNTTADSGTGSLRMAIDQSNTSGGADTITFDATVFATPQTIDLVSQLPTITDDLTINGPGQDLLTIDAGDGADNTFNTGDGFRIFEIDDSDNSNLIDVSLSGMTLTGGDITGSFNGDPAGRGGGIRNLENLTLTDSTVSGNATVNSGNNESGGGIYHHYGTLDIGGSRISENRSQKGGGVRNRATVTVTGSTISGNTANDNGGGIHNSGTLTVTSSTISGNTAHSGGGVNSSGTLTVTNSTISGNTASGNGGGIYVDYSTLNMTSSTISGNTAESGGGIYEFDGSLNVTSSIVAGNTATSDPNVYGSLNTNNFNLIGGNPLMGPLADNGGPTQTHALLPGSPALDNGSSAEPFDQRGVGFLRNDGNGVDIGAYEAMSLTFVVDTTSDVSNGDFSPGDLSLREAVELSNDNAKRDVIQFSQLFTTPQTISLSGQLPTITDGVTIEGPGSDLLTIDAGNGTDNVFDTGDGFRIFDIDDSDSNLIEVTLSGMTLTGGDLPNVSGSNGGAIRSVENLTLIDSTVSGNGSGFNGGGIHHQSGVAHIVRSTVSENQANNNGGGLNVVGGGTLHLTLSTISGNSSTRVGGGGIHVRGATLNVSSSTISGNLANGVGGGIFNRGTTTINNSIVANSLSGGDIENTGTLSGANNLVEDGTGSGLTGTISSPPMLGHLTDNGGPTKTHALLPGSPAINMGANPNGLTTDQRGAVRDDGGGVDIGAFELHTFFIVNDVGDAPAIMAGDGVCEATAAVGDCTLRAAIMEANALANIPNAPDMIFFDIPGVSHTINLGSGLPSITDAVIIDGSSEPDFADAPVVQINADGTINDGLRLDANGSTISGLSITGFANDGIEILAGASDNSISSNFLGLDPVGNADGNRFGLKVSSTGNIVSNNVISGNTGSGVFVSASGTSNTFSENLVGTDPTGSSARPNLGAGVNVSGTDNSIVDNLVSGNAKQGILLNGAASKTTVQGNLVGTKADGLSALANGAFGILVQSSSNTIDGNLISGNVRQGLILNDADDNTIQGNLIGVDLLGSNAIANTSYGLYILDSDNNTIDGNLISGNGASGVAFANSNGNTFSDNKVGTDALGQSAVPNSAFGIFLLAGASGNMLTGNHVAGNSATGIGLVSNDTTNNTIADNNIGFNDDFTGALANGTFAVLVSSPNNVIDNNTIGHSTRGVVLSGIDATDNVVSNNDITQTTTGVQIAGGAFDNVVGPDNNISSNQTGVRLLGNSGNGNSVTQSTFSGNTTIGIDLADPGATSNDTDDIDEGANRGQNHPDIGSAEIVGSNLNVTFHVPSPPTNAAYPLTIEFFKSDSLGQGELFLASVSFPVAHFNAGGITRALSGVAAAAGLVDGDFISATATDDAGNTSEFSAAVQIGPLAELISGGSTNGGLITSNSPAARTSLDVNKDGKVSAADPLTIINKLSEANESSKEMQLAGDVNGDGKMTPVDALQVINWLGTQSNHSIESESNQFALLVDRVFSEADDEDEFAMLSESLQF